MENALTIRPLTPSDIPEADAVLKCAFTSHVSRSVDLEFYLEMQPDGWFVAEMGKQLIGMVGAVRYGLLAHVGFMAIHPNCQRQGAGMALMTHLLTYLDQKGVRQITLDASHAGEGLYARLGFASQGMVTTFAYLESCHSAALSGKVELVTAQNLDELARWDAPVFGGDRRKVFQILSKAAPERAFLQRDLHGNLRGYIFAQARRIGPWLATDGEAAENLLKAALNLHFNDQMVASVPNENQAAVNLLLRYGFLTDHTNTHMMRGSSPLAGSRDIIFAQTSLAVG